MNYTKQLYSSLFLFIALLFFQSCETEPLEGEFGTGEMPASSGNFQVDFNGSTFQTNQVGASVLDNLISIGAVSGDETFTLAIVGSSVGTYQLGTVDLNNPGVPSIAGYIGTQDPAESENQTWASINPTNPMVSAGSVVITNIDYQNNTISGTFSFSGYNANMEPNTIEFTNGSFTNVSFQAGLPNDNPDGNEFYAEIDGVEFVEDAINVDTSSGTSIGIMATTNSLENILVALPADVSTGTYNFGIPPDFTNPYIQYSEFNDPTNTPLLEGTIQVTTHDVATGHIVGTFSCVGELGDGSTMTISNGSFDVYY